MSGAFGNVRGYLYKDPQMKRSKSGSDYSTATIKVRDGDANKFWRVMAFKENAPILMNFKDGEGMKAEGALKFETYEKDGQTRVSLTVMANSIEAYSPQGKADTRDDSKPIRRSPQAQAANGPNSDFRMRHHGGSSYDKDLSDDIPF